MRNLYYQLFVIIITFGFLCCRPEGGHLSAISTSQHPIDSTLQAEDSVEAFLLPYRQHVNEVLDKPLAYAPITLSKTDGKRNTSIGNLMADIVLLAADSVSRLQNGPAVDMALLNHGGIRAVISQGPVSARTAYEVMPFENTIALARLQGREIREMVRFLVDANRAHPIAGMRIRLDADGRLDSVSLGGEPLDENREYWVATSNYLVNGGDNMQFFGNALEIRDTGYRIRNAMIDYFTTTDTLRAAVDDRFTQQLP